MPIYCNVHHEKQARYLCKEDGFLCELHEEAEATKDHVVIFIGDKLRSLYSSMLFIKKASLLNQFISLAKETLLNIFDTESDHILSQSIAEAANANKLKQNKCFAEVQEISKLMQSSINIEIANNMQTFITDLGEKLFEKIKAKFVSTQNQFLDKYLKNNQIKNSELDNCSDKLSINFN